MVQKTPSISITPSIALLLALSYSTIIALQTHLFFPMLFPLIFMMMIARSHWVILLKRLFWLNTLILLVVLTLFIQNNVSLALLIFIRSNLILAFILLLFYDKDEFAISLGMRQLRFPHKLTALFFFTAKSIFLIKREFELFKNTLHVRGFSPKTDLLTYKTMAGFVGILLIKALERSTQLQKAMHLRGFKGEVYTLNSHVTLSGYDILLCAITLLALTLRIGILI